MPMKTAKTIEYRHLDAAPILRGQLWRLHQSNPILPTIRQHQHRQIATFRTSEKMTGPNRTVIKRRLGHVFALFRRKGFLMEVDKAEGPSAWRQCRGIHPAAHKHLPEYGSDFQIHIQTPFKKLNIYTATLSIPGDPEPLFLTKSCPTPTEALETLRVMIMVSEDPLTKEKLANLQWEAMVAHHNNQMMRYSPKGLSEQDSNWS
ncbi:hypothetical protein D6D29_03849 [Aureobasidium pullulans]|nr:hypothetical protein D6D29_03849 [Aureobasidium pullulans]